MDEEIEPTHYMDDDIHYTNYELRLKLQMRKLLTDNAIFTRQFIVDLLGNLSSMDHTTERLLRNQEQTGNYFRPFFGDVAADNIILLLKGHITTAVDLLKAIKIGDTANIATLEEKWTVNAESISNFLSAINQNYSIDELINLFETHLILVKYQFIARMNGDYSADILYFDMGLNHLLRISDYLTNGIIEGFISE